MERNRSYWNRFTRDLEEKQGFIVGKPLLLALREKLKAQTGLGHLLEVGCGTGTFTESLLPGALRITATDISEAMTETAAKRFAGIPVIEVHRENCYALSFPDNSFDSLFMGNLLHIIPFPEKALGEARRVVKPGGKLIVTSFTTWGMEKERKNALNKRYKEAFGKAPENRRALSPKDLEDLTTSSSFQTEEIHIFDDLGRSLFLRAS